MTDEAPAVGDDGAPPKAPSETLAFRPHALREVLLAVVCFWAVVTAVIVWFL